MPRIVFHGMRHTHATLLLEDGVSIKVVASVGTWWKEGTTAVPAASPELEELRATVASLRELVTDLQIQNAELRSSREQSVSETPE